MGAFVWWSAWFECLTCVVWCGCCRLSCEARGASRLYQGRRVCTGVMGWDVLSWIWEVREEGAGKEGSEAPVQPWCTRVLVLTSRGARCLEPGGLCGCTRLWVWKAIIIACDPVVFWKDCFGLYEMIGFSIEWIKYGGRGHSRMFVGSRYCLGTMLP